MRHKHYDAIIAFAEGKQIQYKLVGGSLWMECNDSPLFNKDMEYRVKPEVKKIQYRLALFKDSSTVGVANTRNVASAWESGPRFVKWLTDWVEVEIEE